MGLVILKRLSPALAVAASLWLSVNGAVIVQLRVIEGEGGVYGAGTRATRGITVQVTDESGKPVEGAAVSFRLPDEGPSGVFASGLRTEVVTTKPDGRASVWGMQWNKAAGPFEIRITAVKDQARAGIVSAQYLSDNQQAAKSGGSSGGFQTSHHSRNKWLLITAAAAGAGAALLFAKPATTTAAASVASAPTVIGNPTVTIGPPR